MDKEKLTLLAEGAIVEYFEHLDDVVKEIAYMIADANKIEDDEDITYLKNRIMRGIVKFDKL